MTFSKYWKKKKRCSPASTPDWLESQGVQSLGIRISQQLVQPHHRFFCPPLMIGWRVQGACPGHPASWCHGPPAPMFLFTYWLTVGMDRLAYLMTLVQSHLLIFLFWLVRSWKKMSGLLAPPPPSRIRRLGQENCMPHSWLLNPILRFAYFSIRDYLF